MFRFVGNGRGMKSKELTEIFQKFYWIILIPAVLAVCVLALNQTFGTPFLTRQASRPVSLCILVLTGVLAIILPLWQRIMFCRHQTGKSGTDLKIFLRFEKRFMLSGLLATYMIPLGYFCRLPQVPLFWIIIFSLYAVYYYFPSRKRIALESKIFRVLEVE